MDLSKAYDTVDRPRALEIFRQYGIGPNALRLMKAFWDRQQVVAKQCGFHGSPFHAEQGETQGGIVLPPAFNILMDAAVCEWLVPLLMIRDTQLRMRALEPLLPNG